MAKSSNEPERPRAEPEIIPPDRSQTRSSGWPPYGVRQSPFTQSAGMHRVYVSRIGPIGFALLILVIGLFAGILLLALIGTALIWIPLVAVLVVAAAVSRLLRRL
jgi:Flp pilus assembly protein TadB